METPVKKAPEFQWVSAGKELHGDYIKQAADEWCATNQDWKYAEESKQEVHGEGDSTQQITYFKVTKVETSAQKKKNNLPSSGPTSGKLPVSQQEPIS